MGTGHQARTETVRGRKRSLKKQKKELEKEGNRTHVTGNWEGDYLREQHRLGQDAGPQGD